MGTSVKKNLTPYQGIPHYARGLKIYSTKDMKSMDDLLGAMRTWNLHGSADKIESWADRMYDCIEAEHDALPLGIIDWNDIVLKETNDRPD